MTDDYSIREYQAADREQIEDVSWQIQEWEKQYFSGRAVSKEIIAKHVDRLISLVNKGEGTILVAISQDRCIGYVVGSVHNDFLNIEPVFYVNDMGVDKEHRGKGVGTELLRKIEQVGKEKYRLNKIMIAIICGNDGAEKLYKKMGYIPYELELIKSI